MGDFIQDNPQSGDSPPKKPSLARLNPQDWRAMEADSGAVPNDAQVPIREQMAHLQKLNPLPNAPPMVQVHYAYTVLIPKLYKRLEEAEAQIRKASKGRRGAGRAR